MDDKFQSHTMENGFQACLISVVAVYIGSHFSDGYVYKENAGAFFGLKAKPSLSTIDSPQL